MDITHDPITAGMVKTLIDTPSSSSPLGSTATFASQDAEITLPDGSVWIKEGYADFDVAQYPELAAINGLGTSHVTSNHFGLSLTQFAGSSASVVLNDGRVLVVTKNFDVLFGDVNGLNWTKGVSPDASNGTVPTTLQNFGSFILGANASGWVWRSTDSGVTWSLSTTQLTGSGVFKFLNTGAFIFAYSTTHGYRHRSDDNGITWTEMPLVNGTRQVTSSAVVADNGTLLVAVSSYGLVRFPTGASVWTQVTPVLVGNIGKANNGTLIATGATGAISTSTDGVTWVVKTAKGTSAGAYLGVLPSGKVAFTFSTGRASSDDGTTWTTTGGTTVITRLNAGKSICVGSGGAITVFTGPSDIETTTTAWPFTGTYHPNDGPQVASAIVAIAGDSLLIGNEHNANQFRVVTSNNGGAFGYYTGVAGNITATYGAGSEYNTLGTSVRALDNTIYAVATLLPQESVAISKSTDNGLTWQRIPIPESVKMSGSYVGTPSVVEMADGVPLFFTSRNAIWNLAGNITLPSPINNSTYFHYCPTDKELFYVNSSLKLVRTTDGITWETSIASLPNADYRIMKRADGSYVWPYNGTSGDYVSVLPTFTSSTIQSQVRVVAPYVNTYTSFTWKMFDGNLLLNGNYTDVSTVTDRSGFSILYSDGRIEHYMGTGYDSKVLESGAFKIVRGQWQHTVGNEITDTGVFSQSPASPNWKPPFPLGQGVYIGWTNSSLTPYVKASSAGHATLVSGTHMRVK